jgi:hypothetical protein
VVALIICELVQVPQLINEAVLGMTIALHLP